MNLGFQVRYFCFVSIHRKNKNDTSFQRSMGKYPRLVEYFLSEIYDRAITSIVDRHLKRPLPKACTRKGRRSSRPTIKILGCSSRVSRWGCLLRFLSRVTFSSLWYNHVESHDKFSLCHFTRAVHYVRQVERTV